MWYNIIKERQVIKMKNTRMPRLNSYHIRELETKGWTTSGKNTYEVIEYLNGECVLYRENQITGSTESWDWNEVLDKFTR